VTVVNRLAHESLTDMGFADRLGLHHEATWVRFVLEATAWDTAGTSASAGRSDLKPVAECWF
jgi:hypothetical protein